uniref:Uncharacterized protein n=1 Tax=Ciona savignyi TaxID=51511 RepID=H2YBP8_CIOSA
MIRGRMVQGTHTAHEETLNQRTIKPGVRKQDPECKVEQRNVTIPRDHHPVGSSSSSSDSSSDSD